MGCMRSSNRGETTSTAARDIDFPHLWRQLRTAGWKAKRPTGLQTEWTYCSPDGKTVLVGETSVLDHVVASGLLDEAEDGANIDASGDGDIHASQIDTSIELSQRTVDALFEEATSAEGSAAASRVENEDDDASSHQEIVSDEGMDAGDKTIDDINERDAACDDLSQAAIMRAFDLSQSDICATASQQSVRLLSNDSDHESDEEKDEEPSRVETPHYYEKPDINYVPDDEKMDDYESFSSDESEDDVDGLADDEGDIDARPTESDNKEVVSDSDAALMDEAYVRLLQIGNDALSRHAAKGREEALRSTEWTPVSSKRL